MKDYDVLVDTGQKYREDTEIFSQMNQAFIDSSEELLKTIQYVATALSEIDKGAHETSQATENISTRTSAISENSKDIYQLVEAMSLSFKQLKEMLETFKTQ